MSYVSQSFDERVVGLLKSGGVGFMPSDTIYGLSCRALDEPAVSKLHRIKARDNKPFIVLISDEKMLNPIGIRWRESYGAGLLNKYWPGPLTVVLPAPGAPAWLTLGTGTLAVRLPDNSALQKLIGQVGPIVSTSANLSGQPPINNVVEAKQEFGKALDFYVDAGQLPAALASTIVKPTANGLEILRQGAVKIDEKEKRDDS